MSTSSLSSSVESCTQVTLLKLKACGNQTTVAETFTSATSTVENPAEEICIQTCDNNPLLKTECLPVSIRNIITDGTLQELCCKLESEGQLNDFSSLLANIANGKIPTENISWLLNLHLGKLMSLDSTTQMRWHKDIVDFFSIIYILFGASAINVLHSPMHFSDLVMENVEKGKFSPANAKINIPVPSINTLRNVSTGYPKEIPCGLVEHTLDIAEIAALKGSQYILSFDGKLVAKGFKGETYGDIDLWGIEKPISLQSALMLLKHNLQSADVITKPLKQGSLFRRIMHLSITFESSIVENYDIT